LRLFPADGAIIRSVRRRTALLAVAALVLAACGGDNGGFGEGGTRPTTPTATTPRQTLPPLPDRVIAVETPGYRFEPAVVVLPRGRAVTLELRNTDDQAHSLRVDELSIELTANPGETVRLPVEAPESASFAMYCSLAGHRAAGHEGRLDVG
jgi:cupredoxin-like protein